MTEATPPLADAGQRQRRWTRRLLWLVAGLLVSFILLVAGGLYRAGDPLRQITVSPETTHWTEPLDETGFVDFEAIAKSLHAEPIPPETNAAVPLIRACGIEVMAADSAVTSDAVVLEEFFKSIGMEDPGEPAFVSLEEFALKQGWSVPSNRLNKTDSPFDLLFQQFVKTDRPWTPVEFPDVAKWLEQNERALVLIKEASKRPEFWNPDPQEISVAFNSRMRRAIELLSVSAYLSVGTANPGKALDDALILHRLARLLAEGNGLPSARLWAGSTEIKAFHIESTIIARGELSRDEMQAYLEELNRLPPMPVWMNVTMVDVNSRLDSVRDVSALAREEKLGNESTLLSILFLRDEQLANALESVPRRFINTAIDWNSVMRFINEQFDRAVEAVRFDEYPARIAALAALHHDLNTIAADVDKGSPRWELVRGLLGDRGAISRRLAVRLFPAGWFTAFTREDYRTRAHLSVARGGFALMTFRADRGEFPDSLSELIPEYLPEIPLDPFTDQPLIYHRTDDGFRLYSVGENLTGNGGANYDDTPQADDIRVQYPADERPETQ